MVKVTTYEGDEVITEYYKCDGCGRKTDEKSLIVALHAILSKGQKSLEIWLPFSSERGFLEPLELCMDCAKEIRLDLS